MYVVLFHCWLYTFPKFPENTGPVWLGWMMHGRLAVVFFLMLSGFSLAISASRNGWQLGGLVRFARRRAWRILPTYWAALVFSLLVAWFIQPASYAGPPTGKSVVAYGLLLQDVVRAPTPNGTFWSIAIEAELYLAFPLLLLIRRRWGAVMLLICVTLPVIAMGLLVPNDIFAEGGSHGLAVDFAPIFALGLVAAGVIAAPDRIRRLPWPWLAALAAAPVMVLIVAKGSVWTVTNYFWIDLALGPAMAMLLAAVATGRPAALMRLLDTRPMRSLGGFSYSLYLVHLPIVVVIARRFARPHFGSDLSEFWVTLVLGVPLSVIAAWLFAKLFETPFQRFRSWASLRSAVRTQYARWQSPPDREPASSQPETPEYAHSEATK